MPFNASNPLLLAGSAGEEGDILAMEKVIQMADIEADDEFDEESYGEVTGVLPSSSTSHYADLNLAHLALDSIPAHYLTRSSVYHPKLVKSISLHHNHILTLPAEVSVFQKLVALDCSNNGLTEIPDALCRLSRLRVLLIKANNLETSSFPKAFNWLSSLEVLNLSGNLLDELPEQILALPRLKALYVGSNRLHCLPYRISQLSSLDLLYLGGNRLREIPATIGQLKWLTSLVLCDNLLETLPPTVADLQQLQSLSLHNNRLKMLPTEIVTLRNLHQLSLRSNPLVARFVRDMTFDPPSLQELAARVVKIRNIHYDQQLIPSTLCAYLASAHQCVNPRCKGVYFEARVEHVKFVDFCGKFRVPLLQYLCSPSCDASPAYLISDSSSEDNDNEVDPAVPEGIMRKVLLG